MNGLNTTRIARALGLDEAASEPDILAAISAQRSTPTDNDIRIRALADKAIALGRLSRRLRPWAVAYARRDPRGFAAFVECAPEQPVRSASWELVALARERSEESKGTIDLAAALNVIVREEPDLAAQVEEERARGIGR